MFKELSELAVESVGWSKKTRSAPQQENQIHNYKAEKSKLAIELQKDRKCTYVHTELAMILLQIQHFVRGN